MKTHRNNSGYILR